MDDDKNNIKADQRKEKLQISGDVAAEGIQIDKPTAEKPSSEKTQIELREITEDELKQILEDHKKWLESGGKEGERADLQDVNLRGFHLQKAILNEANLQKADLSKANLRKTELLKANLEKAVLVRANLEKADLDRANLEKANLRKANLRKTIFYRANLQKADFAEADLSKASFVEANLRNANFLFAKLHYAQIPKADLRGANLTAATLKKANLSKTNLEGSDLTSADIAEASFVYSKLNYVEFINTKGIKEASFDHANFENAIGFLGNEFAHSKLIGCELPKAIRDFEILKNVEQTSQNARKIFFAMLLGCVYSWLTIATTTDVRLLTNTSSSPLPIIQTEIPIAGFYWAAPLVLMCIYVYFHFYLLKLWTALASLPAIFPDGKRLEERAYPWLLNDLVCRYFKILSDRSRIMHLKEWVTILLAWWVVPITMIGFWIRYIMRHELIGTSIHIFLLLFSIASSLIFFQLCKTILQGDELESFSLKNYVKAKRIFVFILAGFSFIVVSIVGFTYWGADFREMDISIKPSDYYKIDSFGKQIESVKGANLKGRNLNNADMISAFLIKADLRDSNLQKADLRSANLQNANLADANLLQADLRGANLQQAILMFTKLQQTDLRGVNLQQAKFWSANLQNANLLSANLKQADLRGANLKQVALGDANLHKTNLKEANLQKADLREAKNLTIEQLSKVKSLYRAKLDPELLEQVKKCCPHLLEKPKEETDQTK